MVKTEITGYWMLICNPKTWQIDEFLESNEIYTTWRVTDWQKQAFKAGQHGIVRVGIDRRTLNELDGKSRLDSGVYAIVEIQSEASLMPYINDEYWLNSDKVKEDKPRVRIKILKNLLELPVLMDTLKNNQITKTEDCLIGGREASTWPISKDTFNEVLQLTDSNLGLINKVKDEEFSSIEELYKLEKKYRNSSPRIKEIVSRKIERGSISRAIKKLNGYECQICKALNKNPLVFKKKKKGNYYIETHHVIPVSELKEGTLGFMNLITVCPNHHRQLHYGDACIIENNDSYFEFKIEKQIIKIEKIKLKPKANSVGG